MRAKRLRSLSAFHRIFSISALVVSLIAGSLEVSFLTPMANLSLVKAANDADSDLFLANESISTYRWNLGDEGLPLVSLPDHIRGNLDLSFTYSMGQFQFPLFQSLYFNKQMGKYILMVIPKHGRRAQFIDLEPGEGLDQFEAKAESLMLAGEGNHKLLSTSDGTVYTFAPFEDGELRCSQISDRDGLIINLKYTKDSFIDTISDASGRTIKFSYTNDYLSAVTQTWELDQARLTKTWAIDVAHTTTSTLSGGTVRMEASKHIPSNAISPAYTGDMAASDSRLASIFGGPGAIAAANGFEPRALGSQYPLYRGGSIGSYRHSHIEFYRGNTGLPSTSMRARLRIDPVTVFSSTGREHQAAE